MPSDRTVKVRLTGDISQFNQAMLAASTGTKAFVRELDSSNDRMSRLVQTSLALGPALVPIGAAFVPALSGLTSQLALSAGAAGVAVLAFQGIGDALKATNDYAIEPSAANFDKLQQSLSEIGPAGREFVGFLQEIRPELQGLQDAAQAGLLPGAEEGIRELMTVLPQAEQVVGTFASTIGTLLAEAGDNLNDPRWVEFFEYIEGEAKTTLLDFGRSLGNFTEGFANLWRTFDPISDDFSDAFLRMSRDFATWTAGLGETQGFQDFVDYIADNGPQAWETLGALGNALLELVEAAAPIGAASLPIIEALADTFSAIADTPVGPALIGAAAGISAISRSIALLNVAQGGAIATLFGRTALGGAGRLAKDLPAASKAFGGLNTAVGRASTSVAGATVITDRYRSALGGAAKAAGAAGGLAFVMSDLDNQMGLSNTAMLTLVGSMLGPWGAAVGAGVGLTKDFAAANDDLWQAIDRANEALDQGPGNLEQQGAAIDATRQKVEDLKNVISGEDDSFLTNFLPGLDDIKRIKNMFEGIFGSSDVEEADRGFAGLGTRYEEVGRAAQDLKFEEAGLGDSLDDASDSVRDQTEAVVDNIDAHNNLADTLLGRRSSMRDLEAAFDDASASIEEHGKTLDINTEAGRANQDSLDKIAEEWNGLDVEMQGNAKTQERARAEFIKTAIRMGKNEEQAEDMADKYLDIPTSVETEVTLRDGASFKIGAIAGGLTGLNGDTATVYINAIQTGASIGAIGAQLSALNGNAGGFADGGILRGPGTGTSDSIPLWGSDGEYVVRAKSVEQYGVKMFDDLNAGRFADGGFVGASRAPATYSQPSTHSTVAATPFPDRFAIQITNWETGEGRMVAIAQGAVSGAARDAAGRRSTTGLRS